MTDAHAARRAALRKPAVWIPAVVLLGAAILGVVVWTRPALDEAMTATVQRGTLTARLTLSGILKPVLSTTYRSPLGGRETEVTFLVPEGTRVGEGDLLIRLDASALERELERANQEVRQAQVDLQVADIDRQEGQAAIDSLSEGEAALTVEETRTRLQQAEKKAARLRAEQETLEPLMAKGFITREELKRVMDEREQADQDLAIAKRRSDVLIERTYPRDRQRARLQLAQKDAQRENVRARLQETQTKLKLLREQIENCSVYARGPGLVVYEDYLGGNPRRKIRVGDRVTESQGIVTIPEVSRMVVDASIAEADVHRLHEGQSARIVLEAFRDRRFSGKVTRIGTLARSSAERPLEDKRFDVSVEVDHPDETLRPEMTARVDVLLGERAGVLLIPINAVFDRQGLHVSYVVRRTGVEMRTVQLGETGDTAVEVTSGLKEGERVALTTASPAGTEQPQTSPGARGTLKTLDSH